ncbi:protease propeptide/inhibitor [Mycena galericulata]|nr:protease propeptide/inhibitor [Mycena galericulata]
MSGKYIVVFKSTASQQAIDEFADTVSKEGGEVIHKYGTVMKGFAARLNDNTLVKFNSLQEDPNSIIDYIEPDGVVTTQ